MTPILLFWIALASPSPELPWDDLALTIVRDFGTSSDTVTLCRVRVLNNGRLTWPGRQIRFEAEALDGGTVMERARGRFGLSLGPHESLETLIGFSGRYDRFLVRLLPKISSEPETKRSGKRSGGKGRGKSGKKGGKRKR
jgi:hypothetical protein